MNNEAQAVFIYEDSTGHQVAMTDPQIYAWVDAGKWPQSDQGGLYEQTTTGPVTGFPTWSDAEVQGMIQQGPSLHAGG